MRTARAFRSVGGAAATTVRDISLQPCWAMRGVQWLKTVKGMFNVRWNRCGHAPLLLLVACTNLVAGLVLSEDPRHDRSAASSSNQIIVPLSASC
jgi:hypothetical protein